MEISIETKHWCPNSKSLLLALKIAVTDPSMHDALAVRLEAVPVEPPVTCRLWLQKALYELDNEGYIKLTRQVGDTEGEAVALTELNQRKKPKNHVPKCG